jgi:uncharacterized protein
MQSTTETRRAIEAAIIETPVTRMLAVVLIASIMLDMNVMIPTPAGVPDATRMSMVAPGSTTSSATTAMTHLMICLSFVMENLRGSEAIGFKSTAKPRIVRALQTAVKTKHQPLSLRSARSTAGLLFAQSPERPLRARRPATIHLGRADCIMTLDDIRHFAVTRSLFPPTSLEAAVEKLGFVQADPIRAPARAQDLTLRPRVEGYRAGDLDRRYAALPIEEDVFINYGFVTRSLHALMHPRAASLWPSTRSVRARAVLAFVRERGTVHPRDVDAQFSHGTVVNYWGGSSNATTHLLEAMHYKGLLRVVRRDRGIRIYAVQEPRPALNGAATRRSRLDDIVDFLVDKYAPLPAASLSFAVTRLRYAVPQWHGDLRRALQRAKQRLVHQRVDGADWYWPPHERPSLDPAPDVVRFLAPFDPVVWDRRRFEMLWAWAYRFEAYTPVAKRKLGYYALPLLWRDRVIGWVNLTVKDGKLEVAPGYVKSRPPRERAFKRGLEAEVERIRVFLNLRGR